MFLHTFFTPLAKESVVRLLDTGVSCERNLLAVLAQASFLLNFFPSIAAGFESARSNPQGF
jgi:hypothetical protein